MKTASKHCFVLFITIFSLFFSGLFTGKLVCEGWMSSFLDKTQEGGEWLWENKQVSIPLLATTSAAIAWYVNRRTKTCKILANRISYKQPGPTRLLVPKYNRNGQLVGHFKKMVDLGPRVVNQYRGLLQGHTSLCGYYALYNALCFTKKNFKSLINKKNFEKQYNKWKKSVAQSRKRKEKTLTGYLSGYSNVDSGELENIIKMHVPQLRGKYSQDEFKDVHLKDNVSVIDNIYFLERAIKVGALAGVDLHTVKNIDSFRNNQAAQTIIVNDSYGVEYGDHASSWHWLAIKLEYIEEKTIQITVVDSLGNDMRKHPILDRIYNLFVNVKVPSSTLVRLK